MELALYREMAAFAQFASDLDASTQKLLARGARLTELLKQAQYSPLPIEQQVVILFTGVKGYLDDIKIADVTRFEQLLLDEFRTKGTDILTTIREENSLSEETEEKISKFIRTFAENFAKT